MNRLDFRRRPSLRRVPAGRLGSVAIAAVLCVGSLVALPAASSAATASARATNAVKAVPAVSAAATVSTAATVSAAATVSSAATVPAVKPTIVLVHGAFADASGWSAEISYLSGLGYPVMAPANPLRGVASDAAYLDGVLATIPGPVVLVGHS